MYGVIVSSRVHLSYVVSYYNTEQHPVFFVQKEDILAKHCHAVLFPLSISKCSSPLAWGISSHPQVTKFRGDTFKRGQLQN